jgi:hypothetical protein
MSPIVIMIVVPLTDGGRVLVKLWYEPLRAPVTYCLGSSGSPCFWQP